MYVSKARGHRTTVTFRRHTAHKNLHDEAGSQNVVEGKIHNEKGLHDIARLTFRRARSAVENLLGARESPADACLESRCELALSQSVILGIRR